MPVTAPGWGSWGLVLVVLAAKLWLAAHLPLLSDECLYWVWSGHPAAGYFDQPPLVAWSLAAQRAILGDGPVALRAIPLLAGAAIPFALMRWCGDPWRWTLWCSALPVLFGLTLAATPDAWLLAAWAVALAGALTGGRGWVIAGIATGIAGLAKYSGIAVFPLALLAVGPREWRSPWPWVGLCAAGALLAPNLWWNAQHDWITLRFQWGEGIASPHPPGAWGPVAQLVGQLAVAGPPAALAAAWWAFGGARAADRIDRICWFTSVPLLLGFALAAIGGPPESHWPAPAWIGLGLGLSRDLGRAGRLAEIGAWFGLLVCGALAVHCFHPLIRLPRDPAARFWEAPLVAGLVEQWALPAGGGPQERPILTERYQEAAAIAYYARLDARPLETCGRPNQYDLWPAPLPDQALFVRPATGGPPDCLGDHWSAVHGPNRIDGVDPTGRMAGRWQVFELGAAVE
jgi:4-amino-4-deoxy-L-arabinose transferase-like glycosyltransferase